MIHEILRWVLPIEQHQIGAKRMNNGHKCVIWIVSAIVAITGIVITKDLESAIWIMMISLATSILTQ